MRVAVVLLLVLPALVCPLSTVSASAQVRVPAPVTTMDDDRGTDVLATFVDSLKLLMLEHGTRIAFQEKTRRELKGPFWSDYRRSVRVPAQWDDGDSWGVNYIGHPIHGAAAGYLWLDHDPAASTRASMGKQYWASRGRATAWSAVYSLQFEIGPLSEASIGNVGMNPKTTGWVDHVVTPVGALGFMVAEDFLDRYVIEKIERRIRNGPTRAALRVISNPGRALSNGATGRMPWARVQRPLNWR